MHDVHQIARALDETAALLAWTAQGRFKARAYEQGARIVASLGDELQAAIEAERLTAIEGIGSALSRQITELWYTGESVLLKRLRSEHPEGAAELSQIKGMTRRRIQALQSQLGIRSVAELKQACEQARVRTVPGFGPKTEQRLAQESERWLARGSEARRILLSQARALAERLERRLLNGGSVSRVELAGAARRGEEILSELTLVIDGDRDGVYNQLQRFPEILRLDRELGVAQLAEGVPLYLHFTGSESRGVRLLRATGSTSHLQALEALAETRGLRLGPDALWTTSGENTAQDTEAAIYQALGLAFVPPELRAGLNELEQARTQGFEGLLSIADIRGAVHCHTTYSDGKHSIEEMARAAQGLGLEYITITDHSQSASYAGGLSVDLLKRQWDEIDEVQERVQIRILKGSESDILADGSLDYDDAVLERLDVVIASIHKRFSMGHDDMTQRLVRAMSWPGFKIWGHALGRLLLQREPIDCDVPKVLDALAASRGAVELNADPHRLDLASEWIPLVRERGIPFVISVDAHSTRGLGALHYGVTLARRGGVMAREVLNTMSAEHFSLRVRPA